MNCGLISYKCLVSNYNGNFDPKGDYHVKDIDLYECDICGSRYLVKAIGLGWHATWDKKRNPEVTTPKVSSATQVKAPATNATNSQPELSSWLKKGAKFIGLLALVAILGAIFYLASQNPETKIIELNTTGTSNVPSTYASDVANTYEIKIDYNGHWSGYTQSGSEKKLISGVGPETIENKLVSWPITANIKKDDRNQGILTVQIWKGNKMIKKKQYR